MDRQGVYVPPNYSGTAIGMEPPPTPHFEDLPQVSNLPRQANEEESTPPPSEDTDLPEVETTSDQSLPAVAVPAQVQPGGSLLGGILNSAHFPFGHGFGFEELFLLGLLLFLMHEDKEDKDDKDAGEGESDLPLTLLLVGALLFCG